MLSLVNAINAHDLGTSIQLKSVKPAGHLCLYGPRINILYTLLILGKFLLVIF